jgi:hypothetical protein
MPNDDPQAFETVEPRNAGFNQWSEIDRDGKRLRSNIRYIARSDGFVSACSSGDDGSKEFGIYVIDDLAFLDDWDRRAYVPGQYGSAVLPVAKGQHWKIKNVSRGKIVIAWMPVR